MYLSHQIILFLFIFKVGKIYSTGKFYTTKTNKKFYIENDQKYTWFDAYSKCLSVNMTLASIDTNAKADEINTLVLGALGRTFLWIGGIASRYSVNSKYIWITTGQQITSTSWETGYPRFSSFYDEYCLVHGHTANMRFANERCTKKYDFMCEEHPRDIKYKQNIQQMENQLQEYRQQLKNQEQLKSNLTNLQQELMRQMELEQQHKELIQQLKQELQQIKTNDANLKQSNETQIDNDLVRKHSFQLSKIFEKQAKNVEELLQKQPEIAENISDELQSTSEKNKKYNALIYQLQHNAYFQINVQKSLNGTN